MKCTCKKDPKKDFKRRASAAAGWTNLETREKAVLYEIRRAFREGKKVTQQKGEK